MHYAEYNGNSFGHKGRKVVVMRENTYNILFYMSASNNPMKGGIERVSSLLAEKFIANGCKCYCLSSTIEGEFGYTESYAIPEPYKASKLNKEYLKKTLDELEIDILIATNMAYDYMYNNLIGLETRAKVISHYHSSPVGNHSVIHRLEGFPISNKILFRKLVFQIQKRRVRANYEGMCSMADKVVLLSDAFIGELRRIVEFPDSKLSVIPNPLTYEDARLCLGGKERNVLWVGRIDESTKRISSMLKIWKLAQPRMPGWKLQVVGGGLELSKWKQRASDMKLCNYEFYDFQNPKPFYEKASIYCMTSNTESWGMTLLESMSFSCVPIVFDSFPTAKEIIEEKTMGFLIEAFDDKAFADCLVELACDAERLNRIAEAAFQKAMSYDMDEIIDKWFSLLNELTKK